MEVGRRPKYYSQAHSRDKSKLKEWRLKPKLAEILGRMEENNCVEYEGENDGGVGIIGGFEGITER